MLITCNGCNSTIRVPDNAAGKRVRCPKCATVIRVPEAESTSAEPETPPPSFPETAVPQTPFEWPVPPADPEAFSTRPIPVPPDHADADYEPAPPHVPPGKRDTYENDDDDDGDDGFDVRRHRPRRPRRPARKQATGVGIASMVLGIVSIVVGIPGAIPSCCCSFFTMLAFACGIFAVVFSFMGKTHGHDAFTMSGMICGFIGIGLSLLGVVLLILVFTVGGGLDEFNRGFNQGRNQGNNPGGRR